MHPIDENSGDDRFFQGLGIMLTIAMILYGLIGLLWLNMVDYPTASPHPTIAKIMLGSVIIGAGLAALEAVTAYCLTLVHRQHPVR